MARRRARYSGNTIEIDPIIRLWLLRILVPLGGASRVFTFAWVSQRRFGHGTWFGTLG